MEQRNLKRGSVSSLPPLREAKLSPILLSNKLAALRVADKEAALLYDENMQRLESPVVEEVKSPRSPFVRPLKLNPPPTVESSAPTTPLTQPVSLDILMEAVTPIQDPLEKKLQRKR